MFVRHCSNVGSADINLLHHEITTRFGQGDQPLEVVVWDGFDQLDKEDAVRFYAGKSWADVLEHLRGLKDEPLSKGAYYLEEWAVLSTPALAYYARAHFEFLFETLTQSPPHEEFVFYLVGQVYQVFYRHKSTPFNSAQTDLIRRIVQHVAERTEALAFDDFNDDIQEWARIALAEMKKHES